MQGNIGDMLEPGRRGWTQQLVCTPLGQAAGLQSAENQKDLREKLQRGSGVVQSFEWRVSKTEKAQNISRKLPVKTEHVEGGHARIADT